MRCLCVSPSLSFISFFSLCTLHFYHFLSFTSNFLILETSCINIGVDYGYFEDFVALNDSIPSVLECQTQCQEHPECFYWNYFSDIPRCALQGRIATLDRNKGNQTIGPKYCPSK